MNANPHEEICIYHGDRIAQILLESNIKFKWDIAIQNESIAIKKGERGIQGFGSTGLA